jgi:ankyrin repeat protein
VNVADARGETALIKAAKKGDLEVVQLLINHGADLLHRDKAGKSALYYALHENNPIGLEIQFCFSDY